MVDHLRDASHVESYARHTTGQCLHDGVGQVIAQRRNHEDVRCLIGLHDGPCVVDIAQRIDGQLELTRYLVGVSSHDHHAPLLFQFGMVCGEFVASLDHIVHALDRIGHALRDEENQLLVEWQMHAQPCLTLVAGTKQPRIDGIGNSRDVLAHEQAAATGLAGKPLAARHELDGMLGQNLSFTLPHLIGQVVLTAATGQESALLAMRRVVRARQSIVTDGRGRPHVVHGPHHRLAVLQNSVDVLE